MRKNGGMRGARRFAAALLALMTLAAAGCGGEDDVVAADVDLAEFEAGLEERYALPVLTDADPLTLFPGLEEYTIVQSVCRVSEMGLYATEIDLFQLANEAEADEVRALLEARQARVTAARGDEAGAAQRAIVADGYIGRHGAYIVMIFAEQAYEMWLDLEDALSAPVDDA